MRIYTKKTKKQKEGVIPIFSYPIASHIFTQRICIEARKSPAYHFTQLTNNENMPITINDFADEYAIYGMVEEHYGNDEDIAYIVDAFGETEIPNHLLEGIDMDSPLYNKDIYPIMYEVFKEFVKEEERENEEKE